MILFPWGRIHTDAHLAKRRKLTKDPPPSAGSRLPPFWEELPGTFERKLDQHVEKKWIHVVTAIINHPKITINGRKLISHHSTDL